MTLEFVVMMPLFLAVLVFSFEFGQFFLAHQSTVNNVRAASRYLSRTDLSFTNLDRANNIIRTGMVQGGVAPDYLANVCPQPLSCVSQNAQRVRMDVLVTVPVSLFGLIGEDRNGIRFRVVEDFKLAGP